MVEGNYEILIERKSEFASECGDFLKHSLFVLSAQKKDCEGVERLKNGVCGGDEVLNPCGEGFLSVFVCCQNVPESGFSCAELALRCVLWCQKLPKFRIFCFL